MIFKVDGVAQQFDPNSFRNSSLNHFPGWTCETPRYSLNVTADGVLTTGICRALTLGNIFDGRLDNKPKHIVCPFPTCTAIPDILVPKSSPDGGKRVEVESPVLNINWDICRRCNFDCWYCSPIFHNGHEEFKSLEDLRVGWTNLIEYIEDIGKYSAVRLHLLGGEPTLQPQFLELLEFLNQTPGKLELTAMTNGSRDSEFYKQVLQAADLTFSMHFDFMKKDVLLRKLDSLGGFLENQRLKRKILIKIMAQPGKVDEAVDLVQSIRNLHRAEYLRIEVLRLRGETYSPSELKAMG